MKEQSIEFTKKNQSVTYLVFCNDDASLVGYFTITIKPITVNAENFSNIMKRKTARVSDVNWMKTYTLSAYLIAQLGRNFKDGMGKLSIQITKVGEQMSAKTYLWIEDRIGKASYKFWTTLMHEICPEVIVESKMNNRELVKAVKGLTDKENRYIIALDNSFDNVQIYMEQKIMKEEADIRDNVFLLNLICFEYTLLEFDYLIDWIYAPEDEFREKRAVAIAAREKLVNIIKSGEMNYKAIQEIIDYDGNLNNHNIEQLSAKLLFDLTRNTGFEVSKGDLGECWRQNCCEWADRQADDICGLDQTKLTLKDKMKCICSGTSICGEFENIGLEVVA